MKPDQIAGAGSREARLFSNDTAISFVTEFNGARSIEIARQSLVPDDYTAYCDFELALAFPFSTVYGSMIHPAVLANSY